MLKNGYDSSVTRRNSLDSLHSSIGDEKEKKIELIDCEIIMMAPALHSAVQANLATEVNRPLSENESPKVPRDYIILCED